MAGWSQSHFLQALGWATLNSFWQMAILWCLFAGANHVLKLSATRKYQVAVGAMLLGFLWFIATFILYYQNGSTAYAFFEFTVTHSNDLLHMCLFSASLAYLLLLLFPAFRLYKNWQFVQIIKKEGFKKADLTYRLFIQKITIQLGITKKVKLVISNLVSSPVTIGFLKPMILLPVAAMNNLSPAQVEAILLHELSHIRRYDYLVNLVVSIIHTVLYFNPFVKAFMNTIESERENCCDELVLQYGYDKVGYATALLHLEKNSGKHGVLTLAAAKQNLLMRIEKIVGMEKKKTFKLIQIVPLFTAIFCVLLFNSILIIKDAQNGSGIAYANDAVFSPWQLNEGNAGKIVVPVTATPMEQRQSSGLMTSYSQIRIDIHNIPGQEPLLRDEASPIMLNITPVNFDNVDGELTKEQREDVKSTVQATKKVVSEMQWKEIEASVADLLTEKEKTMAKKEYMQEVEKVNWQNIEQNLKANYENLDWKMINENVNMAMAQVQLDSLQTVYSRALTAIEKAEKELRAKIKIKCSPIPDCSVQELNTAKQTLRKNIDSIKTIRPKKVVHL